MRFLAFFLTISLCYPLFSGSRPENGDVNGDRKINTADVVYLLQYLFANGPEPIDDPCPPCDSCCPEISRPLKTGSDLTFHLYAGIIKRVLPDTYIPGIYAETDGKSQEGANRHYELVTFGSEDPNDWITVDYATGLMWQTSKSSDLLEFKEAVSYCENLKLGPFEDWRLPNINELLTLLKFETMEGQDCQRTFYVTKTTIDKEYFRGCSGWFWSSTISRGGGVMGIWVPYKHFLFCDPLAFLTAYARAVREILPGDLELVGLPETPRGFYTEPIKNGDLDGNGKRNLADVAYLLSYLFSGGPPPVSNECPPCDFCCPDFPARPLKTGCSLCFEGPCTGEDTTADGWLQAGIPHEFEIVKFREGDPYHWVTVDYSTGLMWHYMYEGPVLTFYEAHALLKKFKTQKVGGYKDWRIPNIFELLTLVDYGADRHVNLGFFDWPPETSRNRDLIFLSSTLNVFKRFLESWDPNDKVCPLYPLIWVYQMYFRKPRALVNPIAEFYYEPTYIRFVRTIKPGDLDQINP